MSGGKVYLCPSCQAAIRSDKESNEGLECTECGYEFGSPAPATGSSVKLPSTASAKGVKGAVVRDVFKDRNGGVAIEAREEPVESVDLTALKEAQPIEDHEIPEGEDEVILSDGRRRVRHKKKRRIKEKNRKLFIFLACWLATIALIFGIFQFNKEKDVLEGGGEEANADVLRETLFFQEHLGSAMSNFMRFAYAGVDDSKRLQEIDRAAVLSAKFARFHSTHPYPQVTGKLSRVSHNLLELEKEPFVPALEIIWKDEKGKRFESVHVWDLKNWKLDWEQFVRYSTKPWSLFREGVEEERGEFRLYMRRRERQVAKDDLKLLFYHDLPGGSDDKSLLRASESPEITLDSESELGRKVLEVLDNLEMEKRAYDSAFGDKDPLRMARVTVVLEWRINEDGELEMFLEDIVGVSWYGSRIRESYMKSQSETEEEEIEEVKTTGEGTE